MKSLKNINYGIAVIGIASLMFGCGLNTMPGDTLDLWDEAVNSVSVTTTPEHAKLSLVNVDRGGYADSTSSVAPDVVHYVQLPSYGAYLMVSYPNHKKRIIRLNPKEKRIHVNLEPVAEIKEKCKSLVTFSRAFAFRSNLPDVSFVVEDEATIPELINDALGNDALNSDENECSDGVEPSMLPSAVVSIEDEDYTPKTGPYNGKIMITTTPEKAELLLDGYLMGTTPIEVPVQSGYHRLVLRESRHEDWNHQITIDENIAKKINVDMVPTSTAIARSKANVEGNI